jgi:hypothetical protein
LRRLHGPALLLAASCAAPPDESESLHGGCLPVAVVRGRVVDARGRGAIVQVRYRGSVPAQHFTDNDGRFVHRLLPDGLVGPGQSAHMTVEPLYAGVGETTGVLLQSLPWWAPPAGADCSAPPGPPDTVTVDVVLPPVRRAVR